MFQHHSVHRDLYLNPFFLSSCSIVVLAGDTLPIEVYCHLPIMCEDRNLAYAYVPSKAVSSSERCTIFLNQIHSTELQHSCLFSSFCRIWAHQLDRSVPPVLSWSNHMMNIKKHMMSVWRKSCLCPNQSEDT